MDPGLLGLGAAFQSSQLAVERQSAMAGLMNKEREIEAQAVHEILASVSLGAGAPPPPPGAGAQMNVVA